MEDEIKCFAALEQIGAEILPGESALDAVLRRLVLTDMVVRPYRYQQADGMRHAFQAWVSASGAIVTAGDLNIFQAGYTAARRGGTHG